jgi:hypothetical protein
VKLVTYEQLTTVNTIYSGDRYNDYSFGLNTTLWDAIKYTYIAGGGEEERVVGTPTSEETTFDFGANPFLQADDVATNHALTRLLDVVENMVFVPFKVRVASGACYDLGDTVRMHGGSAPNPLTSVYCITNLEWHYNGGTVLGGAGGNTAIGSGGSSGGSSGGGGGTGGGGGHTYNDFEGATSSADGTHGLVPAPLIAERDKFLCGDGTWKTVQSGAGGASGGSPFIDTSNVIQAETTVTTESSYTATQNCCIRVESVSRSNDYSQVKINGEVIWSNAHWISGSPISLVLPLYVAEGQVVTFKPNSDGLKYTVYGIYGSVPSYSTTEHKTGRKWIDGRDVWECTYEFTNALACTGQGWTDTRLSNSGIALIINSRGTSASGTCWNGIGASVDTGSTIKIYSMRSGADIQIKYFTIEYVKSS